MLASELERRLAGRQGKGFPDGISPMLRAANLRSVLQWRFDRIDRGAGFELLTDGIHLGERAAGLVAERLEQSLR